MASHESLYESSYESPGFLRHIRDAVLLSFLLLPLALLLPGIAVAEAQKNSVPAMSKRPVAPLVPLNFSGYYAFDWNGFAIGQVSLAIREKIENGENGENGSNGSYEMRAVSKSRGLAELFKEHRGESSTVGVRTASGYFPVTFETNYKIRSKQKHVKLVFDERGRLVEEKIEPPINYRARPRIPDELKHNVTDPLSAIMQLRHKIYAGYLDKKHYFTIDLLDGTRLMRVHVNIVEELELKMNDGLVPALRVTLRRTPLGGFKDKELRKIKKGEPLLHMYFSRDKRMIPLKVALDYFGQVRGILRKQCPSLKQCLR